MGDKQCIHYWKIDRRNVGRCWYCGAVRDFGALLRGESEKLRERQSEIAQGIKRRGRPPGSVRTRHGGKEEKDGRE